LDYSVGFGYEGKTNWSHSFDLAQDGDLRAITEESLAAVEDDEQRLIHVAAQSGNAELVTEICKRDPAAVGYEDKDGCTAIFGAARMGWLDVVKVLVDFGARVDLVARSDGATPLHLAASFGHVSVVEYLFNLGPNIPSYQPGYKYPIHTAAQHGHIAVVAVLGDINLRMPEGISVLHMAVHGGQENMVRYLIDRGADLDAQDDEGGTVLDYLDEGAEHYDFPDSTTRAIVEALGYDADEYFNDRDGGSEYKGYLTPDEL